MRERVTQMDNHFFYQAFVPLGSFNMCDFLYTSELILRLHCVDLIYRDTPSARIDRLIPI